MSDQPSLMQFPCDFSLKVIGISSANFLSDILDIVRKHFPDFDAATLIHRSSGQDKYTAITVTVHVLNQASLDALYREINQHPQIKMVL